MNNVSSLSSFISPTTSSRPASPASNGPNKITTGAYGSSFELSLSRSTNEDGSEKDEITFSAYNGRTNGDFSTLGMQGSGSSFKSAYEALLSNLNHSQDWHDMTQSGQPDVKKELDAEFKDLSAKMGDGDTTVTGAGGGLLTQVGGPFRVHGMSDKLNDYIDALIDSLNHELSKKRSEHLRPALENNLQP